MLLKRKDGEESGLSDTAEHRKTLLRPQIVVLQWVRVGVRVRTFTRCYIAVVLRCCTVQADPGSTVAYPEFNFWEYKSVLFIVKLVS